MAVVRKARAADVDYFLRHAREVDLDEIHAAERHPRAVLLDAVEDAEVLEAGNAPVALFGCVRVVYGYGSPWMIGTDDVRRFAAIVHKVAVEKTGLWVREYGLLCNYVLASNAQSIRWLRRLGFVIEPPAPYGWQGRDFCPFWMEA